ncbi:MAG: hypothetical protein D3925_01195 [Candidatus Electrothrix sp. AR5]|nr:hypothetical protein [Candidatus Electrothrix sp. AR5]
MPGMLCKEELKYYSAENILMIMATAGYLKMLESDAGRALAITAIIILGLAALMGKISWGLGIMVVLGIALLFGARNIVTELGGEVGSCQPD